MSGECTAELVAICISHSIFEKKSALASMMRLPVMGSRYAGPLFGGDTCTYWLTVAPDSAFARGGPLHLYGPFHQPSPPVSRAGVPMPKISPSDFAGCGRGRYRDPATHRCRGPADVPN